MKLDELKEWGLTEEQSNSVMSQYGKDIAKLQRENEKLSSSLEAMQDRAEKAEEALKSFDGVDPKEMQSKIATLEEAAKIAKSEYEQKIYDRDFSDALNTEMESVKFSSDAAKKAVMADIKDAGLKLKDGKILGLSDLIDQIKKNDASAFVDEQQEQLEANKARFTQPSKPGSGNGTITKEQIVAMSNKADRQKAIAKNITLFH